jgi:DNA-directed RNA polymerase specialized sigma subunit
MTKDEVERMLENYPGLSEEIRKIKIELDETYAEKEDEIQNAIKLSRISGMPNSAGLGNPTADAVQRITVKYDTHILHLTNLISELEDEKRIVKEWMRLLPDKEKHIIELCYFKKLKWARISKLAHYSIPRCYEIRTSALNIIIVNHSKT